VCFRPLKQAKIRVFSGICSQKQAENRVFAAICSYYQPISHKNRQNPRFFRILPDFFVSRKMCFCPLKQAKIRVFAVICSQKQAENRVFAEICNYYQSISHKNRQNPRFSWILPDFLVSRKRVLLSAKASENSRFCSNLQSETSGKPRFCSDLQLLSIDFA